MSEKNELEYILNYLEAEHKIDMQTIASAIGYSYDYIRGEKVKEKPSPKLLDLIKIKYADQLKALPQYKASPYIKDADATHLLDEEAQNYANKQEYLKKWMAEKDARLLEAQQRASVAEAEKDRLLTIVENLTKRP